MQLRKSKGILQRGKSLVILYYLQLSGNKFPTLREVDLSHRQLRELRQHLLEISHVCADVFLLGVAEENSFTFHQ